MAQLYSNENFPISAVEALRQLGHDVLTSYDAGNANRRIPDQDVVTYASRQGRAVITQNRRDFIKLHKANPNHHGIIVCTVDADTTALAHRVHKAIAESSPLQGRLIRVNRP